MAKGKNPSTDKAYNDETYDNGSAIGSPDELDQYGVWVKSGPQDFEELSGDEGADVSLDLSRDFSSFAGDEFPDFEVTDDGEAFAGNGDDFDFIESGFEEDSKDGDAAGFENAGDLSLEAQDSIEINIPPDTETLEADIDGEMMDFSFLSETDDLDSPESGDFSVPEGFLTSDDFGEAGDLGTNPGEEETPDFEGLDIGLPEESAAETGVSGESASDFKIDFEDIPDFPEVPLEELPAADEMSAESFPAAGGEVEENGVSSETDISGESAGDFEIEFEDIPDFPEIPLEELPAADETPVESLPAAGDELEESGVSSKADVSGESAGDFEIEFEDIPDFPEVPLEELPAADETPDESLPAASGELEESGVSSETDISGESAGGFEIEFEDIPDFPEVPLEELPATDETPDESPPVADDAGTGGVIPTAGNEVEESAVSTRLLLQIVNELSSIKTELADLKKELAVSKTEILLEKPTGQGAETSFTGADAEIAPAGEPKSRGADDALTEGLEVPDETLPAAEENNTAEAAGFTAPPEDELSEETGKIEGFEEIEEIAEPVPDLDEAVIDLPPELPAENDGEAADAFDSVINDSFAQLIPEGFEEKSSRPPLHAGDATGEDDFFDAGILSEDEGPETELPGADDSMDISSGSVEDIVFDPVPEPKEDTPDGDDEISVSDISLDLGSEFDASALEFEEDTADIPAGTDNDSNDDEENNEGDDPTGFDFADEILESLDISPDIIPIEDDGSDDKENNEGNEPTGLDFADEILESLDISPDIIPIEDDGSDDKENNEDDDPTGFDFADEILESLDILPDIIPIEDDGSDDKENNEGNEPTGLDFASEVLESVDVAPDITSIEDDSIDDKENNEDGEPTGFDFADEVLESLDISPDIIPIEDDGGDDNENNGSGESFEFDFTGEDLEALDISPPDIAPVENETDESTGYFQDMDTIEISEEAFGGDDLDDLPEVFPDLVPEDEPEIELLADEEFLSPEFDEFSITPVEEISESEIEVPEIEIPEEPAVQAPARRKSKPVSARPAVETAPEAKAEDAPPDNVLAGVPVKVREELRTVLSYMDRLLESLPEEKIEEFAQSEYFDTYKKLFQDLGLE